ncbi:glycoside hydrolase family 16 protein [Plenodomus tracheiphilus IPT5]|uniref:Glycoside hydrolase family 16 protein n=1 Tax=Plenodomus tracheiphilus IPT5 TaxID=1408161 RepID=A0A6A7APS7_9PLEO|nr:glycoside hydrolase family 16 protein [Plenodomus tracheiphilus IPT5]
MLLLIITFFLFVNCSSATTDVALCSCGFLDPSTNTVWTDAFIAYGNETEQLPVDSLVAEEFQHTSEQNWNALYRAGSSSANVEHNESTEPGWRGGAWRLKVDRPTRDHAVVGASIRSVRRDILFGSFEATLRSPPPSVGSSTLAMGLDDGNSQTLNLTIMNADDPKDAWTSFQMYGESKSAKTNGPNFADLGKSIASYSNSPWGFVPYRIEWTAEKVNYFIGDALARSINAQETSGRWPVMASTLSIRHSSVGDLYTSQGPPQNGSSAHLGMLRAFFNSSQMSSAEHQSFDSRCLAQQQCLLTDTSLRGSSLYMEASTLPFIERTPHRERSQPAVLVALMCMFISTALLLHALLKRAPWKSKPVPLHQWDTISSRDLRISQRTSNILSVATNLCNYGGHLATPFYGAYTSNSCSSGTSTPGEHSAISSIAESKTRSSLSNSFQVALASLHITLIHFCMTFLPATEMPYLEAHYGIERWIYRIVTPYLLNFSWIGPFFTTSTRFLVVDYLRTGDLGDIAKKTVGRTSRLIIPCAAVAALEYFCIDVGAVSWLENLSSVTWSTWASVSNYTDVRQFLTALIELMYLVPNALPTLSYTYCVGVLWTIPVQLQNSWTSLLAVLVVREIKTPWKRMGYYACSITIHWYAMSWGSFFWVGLLITDLDITYKWKSWLYGRPGFYYPLLACVLLLAMGSPSIDLISHWTTFNFSTAEYGTHPHQRTGRSIRNSVDNGYPPYYVPRLTTFTFSIGIHLLVELSPVVQRVLKHRLFMWLFPHILTLYLIHGLVFWSLGAFICVQLAAHGMPYWANVIIVAFICCIVLFGSLPILTPMIETLGKSVTTKLWKQASEKPAKLLTTLYPFSPGIIKDADKNIAHPVIRCGDLEQNKDHRGQIFLYNAGVNRSEVQPSDQGAGQRTHISAHWQQSYVH